MSKNLTINFNCFIVEVENYLNGGNMLTKITLGMAKVLELKANPITKVLKADKEGEGKIESLSQLALGLNKILKSIVGPILSAIGIFAVIYAIYLGVMYAKAESADKRKDIQGRLIGAIIGAVIIVVGATLCFAINWAYVYWSMSGEKHTITDYDGDNICDYCNTRVGSTDDWYEIHETGAINK